MLMEATEKKLKLEEKKAMLEGKKVQIEMALEEMKMLTLNMMQAWSCKPSVSRRYSVKGSARGEGGEEGGRQGGDDKVSVEVRIASSAGQKMH